MQAPTMLGLAAPAEIYVAAIMAGLHTSAAPLSVQPTWDYVTFADPYSLRPLCTVSDAWWRDDTLAEIYPHLSALRDELQPHELSLASQQVDAPNRGYRLQTAQQIRDGHRAAIRDWIAGNYPAVLRESK